MRKLIFIFANIIILFLLFQTGVQTLFAQTTEPTRQEILRGSITPEREWWDLLHYHLSVEFFPDTKTIKGSNVITFKTLKAGNKMQIDLQEPLKITKVTHRQFRIKISNAKAMFIWFIWKRIAQRDIEDKIDSFLRRQTDRKQKSAVERRHNLGTRRSRRAFYYDHLSGNRREHLVGEQRSRR